MNKESPVVSIIISTCNRAHLIRRAIKSVLGQTFKDFELIVVDDASTDNTEGTVKAFGDERIMYARHGENRGGPAARNTGIKLSRGKYIAFLDDDDEWLPEKLEKQVKKIEEAPDSVGLIYTGSEVKGRKGDVIRTYYPEFRGDVRKKLLLGSLVGSVSRVLIKKECFTNVGLFDESLKSCQDWDMWKRISDHYEFDFVPEILTRIYLHDDTQISTELESLIKGRKGMVEKYREEFEQHPEILVMHLKRLGKLHCINGTWKEAARWFKEALKVKPFEIIKILAWCVVGLPKARLMSSVRKFKKYRITKIEE